LAADRSPDAPVTLASSQLEEMSGNERIKRESKGLFFVVDAKGRHGFRDELDALEQGKEATLSNTAKELSKFFGIYKQQVRGERGKKTHEYIFMVRIKCPGGGRLDTRQWVALDEAADRFADGTLRITSRQGIQYHHVGGRALAPLVRHLNRGYRQQATLGACGDVNRNVMCSPIDALDPEREPRALELAHAIAEELAPRTSSYFEVFLSDGDGRSLTPMNPSEPIYGEQYLPRKFKIGIGHPTDNSVDLRTNDIGLLPVDADGSRFDVWTGGGLGMTHNNPRTAPLLGEYVGRVVREQVVDVTRAILLEQKEHGERGDRKQARWKYTLRRIGIPALRSALRERHGIALADAEPVTLPPMQLHLGWHPQRGGLGYYGISVENGRLAGAQRRAVREAVEKLGLSVVLTPQQDLILCDVRDRAALEAVLDAYGATRPERVSRVRANAMACPAKPTCGLAMTDAENILPAYLDAIERAGLGDVDVVIRMTGCPNNCARPPSAEIGIYGYGKNDHVVLVGGSRNGDRLAHVLYSRISEEKMVPALVGVLRAIRERNAEGLPAGDFLHRAEPAELRSWAGVEDGA
jgi:sulfite reductase beta subunit-like hemoprotein